MIYTMTFNPALDYIVRLDHFKEGETNKSVSESLFLGGKGFNVSTILSRLGYDNVALGFVAGFIGDEIERLIKERGFESQLVHLGEGNSRINVKIKGASETEINASGPKITEDKIDEMFNKLKILKDDDYLVLAGSIPSSLNNNIYEKIMESLSAFKVNYVVDATGDLLMNVLKYKPFLIKPNTRELEELFNIEVKNIDDVIKYARKLQALGARNVLVSMGKDGALLVSEDDHVYQSPAAKGKLINSVGSGDSMVAGFVAGFLKNYSYSDALRMGTACGGATAFSEDLATKEMIDQVYESVKIKEL